MKKTCIIMIVLLLITSIFSNYSYADAEVPLAGLGSPSQAEGAGGSIEGLGDLSQYKGDVGNPTKFIEKAKRIVGVIETIGVVVSVVVLIVIGIKYMLGSVEERADYKKTLIPYIVGAIFVFCISIIPQLIFNFMQNF